MFLKLSFGIFAIACILMYLKYTEPFYMVCKHFSEIPLENKELPQEDYESFTSPNLSFFIESQSENNNTIIRIDDKKYESIKHICKEFFTDYSNHTIMKFTINRFNNLIYSSLNDEITEEFLDNFISNNEPHNLKYILHSIKFIHLFAYSSLLYLIIVSLPNIIAQILLYLFNRALLVIFAVLLIEAFLKIYFSVDSDVVALLDQAIYSQYLEYYPIKKVLEFLTYLYNFVKMIFFS